MTKFIYRNLPNIVSILGTLPVFLLLMEDGYKFLFPLIVYNNFMDDLDGILAAELNLRSQLGSNLDNVADCVTHSLFVLTIGFHFGNGITAVAAAAAVATIAILLRVVSRLTSPSLNGTGSPTNELIRHLLLLLLAARIFDFDPVPFLIALFALHSVSMLAPFRMPFMIRSLAKSTAAVCAVNIVLVTAWLVPMTTPFIAVTFAGAYSYSFLTGARRWFDARQARG